MKLTFAYKVLVPSAILSLGLVLPGFAQSNNRAISSDQISTAAQSMEQAGLDPAAAGDVYHDTAITVKVKSALHRDSATEHSQIHVSTADGIVTLRGNVRS